MCLKVPPSFDDSDADAQVHPMARLIFSAQSNAEVFDKVRQWVSEHDVFLVDVAWSYAGDEDAPCALTIYFRFEDESAG